MTKLMEKLSIDIPTFKLERYAHISLENNKINVTGVNEFGGVYTILKEVKS